MGEQGRFSALPRVVGLVALLFGLSGAIPSAVWAGPEGGPDRGWPIGDLADRPGWTLDLSLPDGDFEVDQDEAEPRRRDTGPAKEYLSPADRWSRDRRESLELHELLRLRQLY